MHVAYRDDEDELLRRLGRRHELNADRLALRAPAWSVKRTARNGTFGGLWLHGRLHGESGDFAAASDLWRPHGHLTMLARRSNTSRPLSDLSVISSNFALL